MEDPVVLSEVNPEINTAKNQVSDNEEISLRDLILKLRVWWKYILSKWKVIFLGVLLGGVLGFFYAKIKKPKYTAELTFVIENSSAGSSMGAYASLAGQFGVDLGGGGGGIFEGDNLMILMKSRSVIQKALLTPLTIDGKKQTLAELYIDFNDYRKQWADDKSPMLDVRFLPGIKPEEFSVEQNILMNGFCSSISSRNLTIEKKEIKSGIIEVNVVSENELFSLKFTQALINVVSDFYIETKTKKSAENLAILQYQTDSVKREFNAAVSGIAISMDANPNANQARQIIRVPSQKRQLDLKINEAILTQLVQNLEMAKVSLRKETPLIQIIDSPVLPLDVLESNKLKSMMIGSFLFAFFIIMAYSLRMAFKNIMAV